MGINRAARVLSRVGGLRVVAVTFLSVLALAAACAHPGLYVAPASIPAKTLGSSTVRISRATYAPRPAGDGVGAMRINCSRSHLNYDDPILKPRQPGASHLHSYFGNTGVNAGSTSASIATTGRSTCTGGIANRTAYWAPAIVDTKSNRVVSMWGVNALQTYYKTGYRGVRPSQIRAMPAGLRMIAGNMRSTRPQALDKFSFHCDRAGTRPQASFPRCAPGDRLVMTIEFPQCWDGRNLDSVDHMRHMAYGTHGVGCPRTHPVAIPSITQNFRYPVPAGGMASWRLVSDTYSGPAGYSAHADWWNGWQKPVFDRVVTNCLRRGLDCSMNLLGDGNMLY